ncbi:MAG TPA: cell envelope integrity protein TolA [Gammaproteobacteria bacterium]|nr:cell envelope integrity protein TolA [Gammaproteobacteria bacterium]
MRPVAVIWSSVLHVALLVAVIVGLPWQFERPRPAIVAAPIQGVIIDQAAIERERKKQEDAARQARLQQQREDRQRREADEQRRLAEQREQQRVADEKRAREEAQRKEEQRLAAERAEQQRKKQEAEAQARREREEAEKRAAEQRRREQAESELQAQLRAEAEANAAREAGLLEQYILMIEDKIKEKWDRPLSARPGIDCVVSVVQLPTGDVVSARVARCNGDDAVRRSIENAVMDASPLPKPPHPSLFERNLNVNFKPEQ